MKRRMLSILLVLLCTVLIVPARAASPQALLKTTAYYGDTAKCNMSAAQAQAFVQVIQIQTAALEQQRASFDWVEGGTLHCYAALFDIGNGNPALFFAGGLVDDSWGEWDDDGCFWGEVGSFGIWQYENGQTVELTGKLNHNGHKLAIYPTHVFFGGYLGSDGLAYDGRVYPFVNGKISTQPSTAAQWEFLNYDYDGPRIFRINGSPATEAQFDAWEDKWEDDSLAGHAYGGGVEGEIWGCCPAEKMMAALNAYAQAKTAVPTAYATTQNIYIDGLPVMFQTYALKDANGNATNYIKLRDVAKALNGTPAQFQVNWDGAVTLTTHSAYTPDGSEFSTPFSGNRPYETATAPTKVNGQTVSCAAILLKDDQGKGYTYYKLRDLGSALGFTVDWSAERGIYIETK